MRNPKITSGVNLSMNFKTDIHHSLLFEDSPPPNSPSLPQMRVLVTYELSMI